MEVELKDMIEDLESLKQSLHEPSLHSSIDKDTSAEVVDCNPYSRLMALQRIGIVENFERIRDFSVAIIVGYYLLSFLIFFHLFSVPYER